jgi:hypothetical protein
MVKQVALPERREGHAPEPASAADGPTATGRPTSTGETGA